MGKLVVDCGGATPVTGSGFHSIPGRFFEVASKSLTMLTEGSWTPLDPAVVPYLTDVRGIIVVGVAREGLGLVCDRKL